MTLKVVWLGRVPYPDAHTQMQALLGARIRDEVPDTLLLCEHEPVYTLGRSRSAPQNVLDPQGVPVLSVERGGDVTFHGPGQLVGYPILKLPPHRQDLHAYLRGLETGLVGLLGTMGIVGGRDERNTGVWVDGRKIAAIGIACRRWVTWHGFALNLDVDLGYFQRIHPCGMDSALVTRICDHMRMPPTLPILAEAAGAALAAWWTGWISDRPG